MTWRPQIRLPFIASCIVLFAGCAGMGQPRWGHARPQDPTKAYKGQVSSRKFAALYPYFSPQQSDASSSLAAAATVLNAASGLRPAQAMTQELVAQLDRSGIWAAKTAQGGPGDDLDGLGLHIMQALYATGVRHLSVAVFHMGQTQSLDQEAALALALERGEQAADSFVIINARQDLLFADGASVGHFVVAGAWDARRRRVLVLDPDDRRLPPYWLPFGRICAAMSTEDTHAGQMRGFLVVKTAR